MKLVIATLVFPLFLFYLKISGKTIWSYKIWLMSSRKPLFVALYDMYFFRYGAYVGLDAEISSEPCFPHGFFGVFISGGASIGRNVVIFQHVTIGSDSLTDGNQGAPTIGDGCYLGAGAKIIGKVTLGNRCRVGANAVVYRDLPDFSVAVQSPTRIIRKTALDNRFFSYRHGKRVYFDDGNWIAEP